MLKFNIWCEARKKKDTFQPLFDLLPDENPDKQPEIPSPPAYRDKGDDAEVIFNPGPPVKPDIKMPPKASHDLLIGRMPKVVRVWDLMQQSKKDPNKIFTVRSFGRTIHVSDLHPMRDNGRIVGYEKSGHRFLVSRKPDDRVLVYTNDK